MNCKKYLLILSFLVLFILPACQNNNEKNETLNNKESVEKNEVKTSENDAKFKTFLNNVYLEYRGINFLRNIPTSSIANYNNEFQIIYNFNAIFQQITQPNQSIFYDFEMPVNNNFNEIESKIEKLNEKREKITFLKNELTKAYEIAQTAKNNINLNANIKETYNAVYEKNVTKLLEKYMDAIVKLDDLIVKQIELNNFILNNKDSIKLLSFSSVVEVVEDNINNEAKEMFNSEKEALENYTKAALSYNNYLNGLIEEKTENNLLNN